MNARQTYKFFRLYGNDKLVSLAKTILMLKGQRVYVNQWQALKSYWWTRVLGR